MARNGKPAERPFATRQELQVAASAHPDLWREITNDSRRVALWLDPRNGLEDEIAELK
jgi:hypothetical protein